MQHVLLIISYVRYCSFNHTYFLIKWSRVTLLHQFLNSEYNPDIQLYNYSDIVNFTCDLGYSHSSGDLIRSCNEHTQWTGVIPVCSSKYMYVPIHVYLYLENMKGSQCEKTCLPGFVKNTGADQPAHPRSLISVLVICCLESNICKLATGEISIC